MSTPSAELGADPERMLARALVVLAIVVALGVAVVGGVRSFEAV